MKRKDELTRKVNCRVGELGPGREWVRKAGTLTALCALPTLIAPQTVEAGGENVRSGAVWDGETGDRLRVRRLERTPEFLQRRDNYLSPHKQGGFNLVSAVGGGDECPGTPIPPGRYTHAAPYTDMGDTSSANSTVDELVGYYGNYDVRGRDVIYSFTLTSRGAGPEIRINSTVAGASFTVYILDGRSGGCPVQNGTIANNWVAFDYGQSGGGVLTDRDLQHLPLNTPLHLFVDSRGTNNGGPYTLTMRDLTVSSGGPRTRLDFDRDGRADLSVFRPSNGFWYVENDHGFSGRQFGLAADILVPADYDGDGKTDIAVFRDGLWYWLNSSDGSFNAFPFGLAGDIPQSGDYDGDGRAELAVFRAGLWYSHNLQTGQFNAVPFGLAGDRPVAGDYDGDGRMDQAVFREGIWYLLRSSLGYDAKLFGSSSDRLVPADYDGDNRTDLAVFRDGIWFISYSTGRNAASVQFGSATDTPVPANYDGVGGDELAIYRDGLWFLRQTTQLPTRRFGLPGDRPLAAANFR